MNDSKSGLRKNSPVFYALLILVLSTIVMLVCSVIAVSLYYLIPGLQERTVYLAQFMLDGLSCVFVLFLLKRLGLEQVLKERRVGFFKGLWVGGYLMVICIYTGIFQAVAARNNTLLPAIDIVIFIATMFLIGLTEELLNRGILSNLLLESFGQTTTGVKYCVLISGILFGLFHLSNAVGGTIAFSGVLVQILSTSAMGMLFAAIYFRTKNIWVVVFLHAFNDFSALIGSGIFNQGTITEAISSYSAINLISMIPMIIVTIILLRPTKLQEIVEENKKDYIVTEYEVGTETAVKDRNITTRFRGTLIGYIAVIGLVALVLCI